MPPPLAPQERVHPIRPACIMGEGWNVVTFTSSLSQGVCEMSMWEHGQLVKSSV